MKKLFCLLLLLMVTPLQANQLKNHPSPYLALHGDDPVNWLEWNKPAFEKAKKENKLLFISSGYFSCHWCHVMQRESFSDKSIAKKLNDNFISVKIDRELNTVLDKRLIEFVQLTNGTAGWPLNVFVTPDGYPLVGITYLPPENFSTVLNQLSIKWKADQKSLREKSKEMNLTLSDMLSKQEEAREGEIRDLAPKFIETAMQYADTLQGGLGEQAKFPQIPHLWALLKINKIEKNSDTDEFLKLTFNKIATQGLHDEIAGGFFRYTTDPDWETPHFEKMLYTSAMMALLFFDAAEHYKNINLRRTALETLYFLRDEMLSFNDGFVTSLSAVDDKNVEGGYYLWQQDELKKILTKEELIIANLFWGMNRANEHTAGNLPRQKISIAELANKASSSEAETIKIVNALKGKIKKHRNKTRTIPKDTKLLSGMNGLVLAAFAEGIKYDPELISTGNKLSNFLMDLWDEKILKRSTANNKQGNFYDYAAVSWGLLKWGSLVNDSKSLKIGTDIAKSTWNEFYQNEIWVEDQLSLLPIHTKLSHIPDSALISPEALILEASYLSSDKNLLAKTKKVLNRVTRALETDLYSYASLLSLSIVIK